MFNYYNKPVYAMARKYTKKRKYRRSRKKYSRRKRRASSSTASLPLGKTFKFRTRYVERNLDINPVAGLPGTYVFSMNGLFDPSVTGGGHQPIGLDQMAQMYDHYTVIGAKIRVTATNLDTAYPQDLIVFLKDSSALTTNVNTVIENGMNRWRELAPSGSGKSSTTITLKCNPSKFFGKKVMGSKEFSSSFGSNPTEQVFAHIMIAPNSNFAETGSVMVSAQIDYIAILTEPKQLLGS